MSLESLLWIGSYFALAVISAVVPWVNAEVLMLSAVPWASTPAVLIGAVVAVTLGQMTGKSFVFWASRHASRRRAADAHPLAESRTSSRSYIARWGQRLNANPRAGISLTFVSSLVGLPPFFLVSIAAGSLGMGFGTFLAAGTAGRAVHFALIAFAPELLRRML